MSKDIHEMTIAELVQHETATRGLIQMAVMRARQEGLSWAAIAVQLGVAPQEAHRRYAHIWKWHADAYGLPLKDNERPK